MAADTIIAAPPFTNNKVDVAGSLGNTIVKVTIFIATIPTLNATALTAAHVFCVISRHLRIGEGWMRMFVGRGKTSANAQLVRCVWTLFLMDFAASDSDGFSAMVKHTAPVFWRSMLLVALALLVPYRRFPDQFRPYRLPLYPLTPTLFAVVCSYMLYSGVMNAGQAGWNGYAVLAASLPSYCCTKQTIVPSA